MKLTTFAAVLAACLAVAAPAANAKGCLKGAVVGGAAGHVAHHHGLLGATAGCLIGRQHAKKKDRELAAQRQAQQQHASR
jgi:parvulin-like peptidyl-prolyl isomerase